MSDLHPHQPTGPFLDGRQVDGTGSVGVRDPFDGALVTTVETGDAAMVRRAIGVAAAHLPPAPAGERARVLTTAAAMVEADAEHFARTICLEAGKPITQARGEVARCVETLRFAAAEALTMTGEMVPMDASAYGAGKVGMLVRTPIGVVGAISPFNFPLNLVAHKAAPAIAAGCPLVLKPASATPLSALLLARVLTDAGLPAGALAVIPGPSDAVGATIVEHPNVPMISFTGSGPVGWGIARAQPAKRVALELGNSSPVVIAADADLELAAARIAASGFTHAGQSCVSVQRVYVERGAHPRLLRLLADAVDALVVGDPHDDATDVGPVIDRDSQKRVMAWIAGARRGGATVVTGGTQDGRLIAPTVLDGITPRMKVSCEEVFGPVVGVAAVGSVDEGIALANGTPFGLQAAIFTSRIDRALGWAARLHFGGVLVNETPTFRVDQQPYGGVKESGNTREGPRWAARHMTEQKLVVLPVADAP
ncbi:MAG: aldehyde dehydrogenase family protein [Thermoleophilia bacterium]|nr:aldehyde dehydrogenase family protein [Thermoleophilia bacterium]